MQSRQHKAYAFCLAGMAVDAALGLTKIFMGWQSGSIAVMGDGFNNVTDVGSTFLLLLTFFMRRSLLIKSIRLGTDGLNI